MRFNVQLFNLGLQCCLLRILSSCRVFTAVLNPPFFGLDSSCFQQIWSSFVKFLAFFNQSICGCQFLVFSCKFFLETVRCSSTTIEFINSQKIEFPLPNFFCSLSVALEEIRFARFCLNLHAHFNFDFGLISSVHLIAQFSFLILKALVVSLVISVILVQVVPEWQS